MSIKNVMITGASGDLGPSIIKALTGAGFNVSILSRSTKTAVPKGVAVVQTDYSPDSLEKALRGQDALIMTVGAWNAICRDLRHTPGKDQALFRPKHNVAALMDEVAAANKITWTSFNTGVFFDWALLNGFSGFDLKKRKVNLLNDGQHKINYTTVSSIAKAVVAALLNPESTKNKDLQIHDFFVSQREILEVLQEKLGSFEIVQLDNDAELARKKAIFDAGDPGNISNLHALVEHYMLGPTGSSSAWGVNDASKSLGLPQLDLKETILSIL